VSARRRAGKYVAAASTAARHALSQRWDALGRAGFYVVLLLIFAGLWRAVFREAGRPPGAGPVEMLWYLALTEWIVLSLPLVHQDVEDDVRSGDIAYLLPRPLSYVGARLAEATGTLLVRMAVLAPIGFGLAWALAGSLPEDPGRLAIAVPLGVAAAFVATTFLVAIGVSAFWLQDSAPLAWIWQKLSFVLGGLILPLAVYPDWLRRIAEWTPFHPLVAGPAGAALGLDPASPGSIALRIAAWGVVAVVLARTLFVRGLRVLDVNGG
jgi:ABC-2 type transport system permease protein